MRRLAALIIKMSERCNLNCSYCYMYNHVDQSYRTRPAFMSAELFECLVGRIGEYLALNPGLTMKLNFHGGEPMLMNHDEFGRRMTLARRELGERVIFVIQTNGTLVDDSWIRVLKEHQVHVGISVDGSPEVHNRLRVYHNGRGSYDDVVRGIRLLQSAGLRPGGLCVISPGTDGLGVYRHLRELGLSTFDFLTPDNTHDSLPQWQKETTVVADYLIPIFDQWLLDDDPRIRIRLFEAVIRLIKGGDARYETLGHAPWNYLIIESDGSIHGNDVFKVCDEGLSDSGLNIRDHSFSDLPRAAPLVYKTTYERLPLASKCRECPEVAICGGGPVPSRYSRKNGFDNPSVWCPDLLKLITHVRGSLLLDTPDTPLQPFVGENDGHHTPAEAV
jgi:uncharacterized protein